MAKKDNILSMNSFSFLKSPNDINKEISRKIKERRKEKKITQEELSKRAGVSYGSIKRFETSGEISLSSLIKIAFVLGIEDDFDNLFNRRQYNSIEEIINGK